MRRANLAIEVQWAQLAILAQEESRELLGMWDRKETGAQSDEQENPDATVNQG